MSKGVTDNGKNMISTENNEKEMSYSSLLTKPVPLGSNSLKAASMVSSGSVPEAKQTHCRESSKCISFIKSLLDDQGRALTVEFLPKKSEKHREVDGTLPLIQHLVQLLVFDVELPW